MSCTSSCLIHGIARVHRLQSRIQCMKALGELNLDQIVSIASAVPEITS